MAGQGGSDLWAFQCHETGDYMVVAAGSKLAALSMLEADYPDYTFIVQGDAADTVRRQYNRIAVLGTSLSEPAGAALTPELSVAEVCAAGSGGSPAEDVLKLSGTVTGRLSRAMPPLQELPTKKGKAHA